VFERKVSAVLPDECDGEKEKDNKNTDKSQKRVKERKFVASFSA
jgi:hypothetical protein